MVAKGTKIVLTEAERQELETRSRSRSLRAADVTRAKLVLALAEGQTYAEIQHRLGCTAPVISLWRQRFVEQRLDGLFARHQGKVAAPESTDLEARILETTRKPPPDGSTHWSTRKLAKHLGVPHMRVARAWNRAGLKPHRFERYMASNDPDFEAKAADVIGLYINPPQHAVVFSLDEKTAIQALDRRDPVLPLSPGRAERHGFEYIRRGTLSLYAALNTRTGAVVGQTAEHHTSAEFVAFLASLVAGYGPEQEIHVILDNLSTHKTKRVNEFLADHPKVHFHFTPTYSSWLNQVELWFSKIERDLIHRGIFTSAADLSRQLMDYITQHNTDPRPIKWKYTDVTRRIVTKHSSGTGN
jgi:transposase